MSLNAVVMCVSFTPRMGLAISLVAMEKEKVKWVILFRIYS